MVMRVQWISHAVGVLAGLDLEIAPGELVAIVGENGTRKTTLLRILASDLRPDAGEIAIRLPLPQGIAARSLT